VLHAASSHQRLGVLWALLALIGGHRRSLAPLVPGRIQPPTRALARPVPAEGVGSRRTMRLKHWTAPQDTQQLIHEKPNDTADNFCSDWQQLAERCLTPDLQTFYIKKSGWPRKHKHFRALCLCGVTRRAKCSIGEPSFPPLEVSVTVV
jgi:hypothetical protein